LIGGTESAHQHFINYFQGAIDRMRSLQSTMTLKDYQYEHIPEKETYILERIDKMLMSRLSTTNQLTTALFSTMFQNLRETLKSDHGNLTNNLAEIFGKSQELHTLFYGLPAPQRAFVYAILGILIVLTGVTAGGLIFVKIGLLKFTKSAGSNDNERQKTVHKAQGPSIFGSQIFPDFNNSIENAMSTCEIPLNRAPHRGQFSIHPNNCSRSTGCLPNHDDMFASLSNPSSPILGTRATSFKSPKTRKGTLGRPRKVHYDGADHEACLQKPNFGNSDSEVESEKKKYIDPLTSPFY
jgi:hypothetical protein